jgi:hypothetical protein
LSVAALLVAGCGGGGDTAQTAPEAPPPDRLAVALQGGGYGSFRVDLECAVADASTCRAVLAALARADDDETCTPADDDRRSIRVTGTIGGERVSAVLRRRTDCETRAYDRVFRAVR